MNYRLLIILIIAFVIVAVCLIKKAIKKKRKSAKGKIYKTTDGYLSNGKSSNKKTRRVVAVEQRDKDGAIAVSKIYGADDKKPQNVIDGLTLTPNKHGTLTKDSVVGTRVIFGVKRNGKYKPIFESDLTKTNDRLTSSEMRKVNKQKGGKTRKNRKTYRNTRKKWKQGFKKK